MIHLTRIGVIGDARCDPETARVAEKVGAWIAKKGACLVCGGLGGVMEAAARGAKKAGGLTIGILPGKSPDEANEFIQIPIVTGMGEARNAMVVRSSQALIAVGGGYGTLSEIAFALKWGIPVIGLGTWELRKEGYPDKIIRVKSAQEAVEKAIRVLNNSTGDEQNFLSRKHEIKKTRNKNSYKTYYKETRNAGKIS